MNFISNIWNHPKTSTAGVLIAVVTIAGVLSQWKGHFTGQGWIGHGDIAGDGNCDGDAGVAGA